LLSPILLQKMMCAYESLMRIFLYGYSPERINPGDKEHTITEDIKGYIWLNS